MNAILSIQKTNEEIQSFFDILKMIERLKKLKYAYESGWEKAELDFKIGEYIDSEFASIVEDRRFKELCDRFFEAEQIFRIYNIFEKISYGLGYARHKSIIKKS